MISSFRCLEFMLRYTHCIIDFYQFHLVMFTNIGTISECFHCNITTNGSRSRGWYKYMKIYYQNLSQKHCESIKYFIGCQLSVAIVIIRESYIYVLFNEFHALNETFKNKQMHIVHCTLS